MYFVDGSCRSFSTTFHTFLAPSCPYGRLLRLAATAEIIGLLHEVSGSRGALVRAFGTVRSRSRNVAFPVSSVINVAGSPFRQEVL